MEKSHMKNEPYVLYALDYIKEALADILSVDVNSLSDRDASALYSAKENIKDALNLLKDNKAKYNVGDKDLENHYCDEMIECIEEE